MTLPGFTAELSLYEQTRHYRAASVSARARYSVSPAQYLAGGVGCYVRCGGKAILKCLLGCLPTLLADPTGVVYTTCALGCAGGSWASVVDCVLDNCI
jgi:hypothetical protein